ncbi:hypothetical protein TNIN_377601 [Trichonephila inaurata madagascariensis]|uniref:Uncharacterized protein n=1 Tax=Trichonephila inaurata madagascariensis TaxID=2747483 RepID=A0A8X7CJ93_9ARAC|nr:hypothetical protein TNIN_377601 [Trichonephila inaurata madagascariensis]
MFPGHPLIHSLALVCEQRDLREKYKENIEHRMTNVLQCSEMYPNKQCPYRDEIASTLQRCKQNEIMDLLTNEQSNSPIRQDPAAYRCHISRVCAQRYDTKNRLFIRIVGLNYLHNS